MLWLAFSLGDECGMLEDMYVAVEELRCVRFQVRKVALVLTVMCGEEKKMFPPGIEPGTLRV